MPEGGHLSPISAMAFLNSRRSSATLMESSLAPISSTPYCFSLPASASALAKLRPVWPPIVGRIASGFSRWMICSSMSTARNAGAVASIAHSMTTPAPVQAEVQQETPGRPGGADDSTRAFACSLTRHGAHVGAVSGLGVGHDGRGVGVDQNHLIALGSAAAGRWRRCKSAGSSGGGGGGGGGESRGSLERLARLGAAVVKLAGLADDDGARADDHDALQVRPLLDAVHRHLPRQEVCGGANGRAGGRRRRGTGSGRGGRGAGADREIATRYFSAAAGVRGAPRTHRARGTPSHPTAAAPLRASHAARAAASAARGRKCRGSGCIVESRAHRSSPPRRRARGAGGTGERTVASAPRRARGSGGRDACADGDTTGIDDRWRGAERGPVSPLSKRQCRGRVGAPRPNQIGHFSTVPPSLR